ncbi:P-loop containing nucleoside triphosphate hydrolase protein [Mycena alexandri]|uniref:RNA helicase n=1 Tax=Mycena alexandri TaxID=1745969 RepID=A0AAD6WQS2_9AGAR|nr:P-loop containing nucleoside triphosphate hydrolase protein [Mycena alexandri]
MPPRKGIVKSGNAGNSSKDSKPAQKTDLKAPEVVEALFPAGFKYPLTLLNERCQKNGWEKPIIDTRRQQGGYAFTVTISKLNKKSGQKETTRMEPHPQARHWGATYAYIFCNGIQLNRVLPPGPRQYWDILAAEHNNCPEHQKWMYNADPFAARKEVDQRQAQAMTLRSSEPRHTAAASGEFAQAPEVKMAGRFAISLYPEAADVAPAVNKQLETLGFTPAQARNAVHLSPLEAAIEYLILHVPECDLPQRFMPSANTSNSFVVSTHAGADDLKRRWIEDKTAKEAGWPIRVVQTCVDADPSLVENWDLLIVTLGRKLMELKIQRFQLALNPTRSIPMKSTLWELLWRTQTQLVMPLFSAPVNLHVSRLRRKKVSLVQDTRLCSSRRLLCRPTYDCISSRKLLIEMEGENLLRKARDFDRCDARFGGDVGCYRRRWPPDMSVVLRHIVPRVETEGMDYDDTPLRTKGGGNYRRDERTSAHIKEDTRKCLSNREKLPAFSAKDEFLSLLQKSRVVVVVGETGGGKTTQLPQFILDSLITSNQGSTASIIVTQPRRLSAISVAARVSAERIEDGSVGYAIRGESKQSKNTQLLFCTTGVVLRRLGSGDTLHMSSHVVVDEVHERSVDGDFLLLELRELLKKHPTLKVILMSATINHETFINYFGGAPLLTIPGFTHPVTDIYLEDIIPMIKYRASASRSTAGRKESGDALQAFRDEHKSKGLDDAAISSIQIISRSDKCMDAMRTALPGGQADVFPLHANLSSDEQRRVFMRTSKWKVIAATNGKVKETQYDPETSMSRLVEARFNMGKYPVPEILRVPLESISLTVKVMREEEDAAWTVLEELGAVDLNGKLTPLGRHISTLPMLVLGTIFQCLGPVLTIAAALSSKPLFLTPMDKRDEASQARARFATAGSDLLTDLAAYDACNKMRSEGQSHENFISPNTIRDITTLRNDFISSLSDLGFIPLASTPANTNLIKAVVLGGLWPAVARVHLPKSAIKFDRVSAGTVQRENIAKEFKMFDLREGPSSFEAAAWKSPFLVYFHKHMTSKVFLRDATEIPLYALLLFGGPVAVNHVAGGLTIGTKDSWIRLKAWPRIGVLVNQLRRLLDAQLQRCVEEGAMLNTSGENPVVRAMLALLTNDGLTE